MPQRICLTCGKWTYYNRTNYKRTNVSSVPRVCACGGDLVQRLKHPSTFAEQLEWAERMLAHYREHPPQHTKYMIEKIERLQRKRDRLAELIGQEASA